MLTYGSEESKEFVEVPDVMLQNMVPLWDDLVDGKCMDTSPHVAKIHVILIKFGLWKTRLYGLRYPMWTRQQSGLGSKMLM